jgi:excinuclease ABC subunit C
MMRRRLAKLGTDEEERFPKPDLIIIDGGKGQLSAIKEVFDDFEIHGIELISLAEREEEVFVSGVPFPLPFDKKTRANMYLQEIRDEAHRFAIEYNRLLRAKRALK